MLWATLTSVFFLFFLLSPSSFSFSASTYVNAQCTTMLKASLTSFFTNLDDKLSVVSDRVELCEMCIKVTKYALLLANHPVTKDFESSVATHACATYHERRADDCVTLSRAIVRKGDYADAAFTPSELNLSVEELRTLIVSKSDQRCAEMSCCGSKIFRRQNHPTANGALQPEDIDAEANALSKQEMELVNERSVILQQKLALDDHLAQLRHDASLLEKTKASMRRHRQSLDELEKRLKHREERLTEKEQDLAERQKLAPYYLPYPVSYPNSPPAPSPSATAAPQPANNNNSPPPSSALSSLEQTSFQPSSDIIYDDHDVDPINDLSEEEENNFLSMLQGIHARRRASPEEYFTLADRDVNFS